MAENRGILSRLIGRKSVESRNSSTVLSSLSSYFLNSFGIATSSGENVTSKGAMAINAVYVSSKIIGESIASLSFNTYRKAEQGRTEEQTEAKMLLGMCPDPENGVTASDFWKAVGISVCTHGNAYAHIIRNPNTARPERIKMWYPWHVHVREDDEGRIFYYHDKDGTHYPDDVLHFKNNSWDGIIGLNPIREQRELIGLAMKQQKYAGSMYGEKPNGYIYTDERLNTEQMEQVTEFWSKQINAGGAQGVGNTPVLGNGMKFAHIPLNPADIEYINTSNLTEDQIYNLYRIPPPIRGDYERATFSNAEQAELVFMKHTILPYVVSFEQEINQKLFPVNNRVSQNPLFCKFNMNTTMRADFKSRTEGYQTLIQNGVLSPNEVRAMEDKNPREGGDAYYMPLNMVREDLMEDVLLKDNNNGQA